MELLQGFNPHKFLEAPAELKRTILREDPFFAEESVRQRWHTLSPMARLLYTKLLAHVLSE
ncbi:hypothetical protein SAMN05444920_116100 [Nonomuraea solani]|uniref:Uncharacterized protein n=1 Tax=Nonomuraea solani TaxID=1144553 RepID=A0A1H6ETL4_9ACTN|nr:hypothetical protein [Nonomuraea solani]SEH00366.1 hypothetical protein SAMN05444920_116100 [Nonomuraea solani]